MDLNALMRRIQQGDREAFATLYTRYNKTVYRVALESTQNEEEARQVVVAVFREMYQTIRSKGPYLGDLYGWLDALTAKQARLRRMMRGDAAPVEVPRTETARQEAPHPEVVWQEAPRQDIPRQEVPRQEPPRREVPRQESPRMTIVRPQTAAATVSDRPRRYTEEEAAALEERAQRRLMRLPEEEEPEPRGAWLSVAALGVTALLLIWVLVGLLGTLSILPRWDLGYAWFNETLFPLF